MEARRTLPVPPGERRRRLRHPEVCSRCRCQIPCGTEAWWSADRKQATCGVCASSAAIGHAAGAAGASSRARYLHLREGRERRLKRRLGGRLGAVVLALTHEPQSTRAWLIGSNGEQQLARALEHKLPGSVVMLHDRRRPGSQANIDHVIVAPSGVWVVDAKSYRGRVERRASGPWWRRKAALFVGGRCRTPLAHGMRPQVAAVRAVLANLPIAADVAVRPVLCFVTSGWRPLARPFEVDGVLVIRPRQLARHIAAAPGLTSADIEQIAEHIALSLPPAAAS